MSKNGCQKREKKQIQIFWFQKCSKLNVNSSLSQFYLKSIGFKSLFSLLYDLWQTSLEGLNSYFYAFIYLHSHILKSTHIQMYQQPSRRNAHIICALRFNSAAELLYVWQSPNRAPPSYTARTHRTTALLIQSMNNASSLSTLLAPFLKHARVNKTKQRV